MSGATARGIGLIGLIGHTGHVGLLGLLAIAAIAGCHLARPAAAPPVSPSASSAPDSPARVSTTALVGSQADCRATFPDQDGWLGGDVAASIPLDGRTGDRIGRRSVWLFGDSFVARAGDPAERRYPFVHNAIALSRCDARGRWTLDFAWGSSANGSVRAGRAGTRAYFEPDPDAAWVARVRSETGEAPYYWPLSGVAVGDAFYVALLRVAKAPARGPFRLPFRPVGVELARIVPTSGPPETWAVHHSTLSSRSDVLPATSLVVDGPFLLAFATLDRGDGRAPRVLVRLPLAALGEGMSDLEPFVERLAADGRWRPGLDPHDARILMDDDASEMSVHFEPDRGEWLAVYGDPTGDAIWLRRAGRPEGPWSERVALLRIPELARAADSLPGKLFCYAGKAHPELAPSGELLVSYVCNVFASGDDALEDVLERLRTTTWIYRPKLVRVAIPPG